MLLDKNKKSKKEYKLDKIVTSIIIWGALAGLIGLSNTDKAKSIMNKMRAEDNFQKLKIWENWFFWKSYEFFWKTLVKFISIFNKKKWLWKKD